MRVYLNVVKSYSQKLWRCDENQVFGPGRCRIFSTAFLGACSTAPEHDAAAQAQSAIKLEARNWDSFNRTQIDQLLKTYGKDSPGYNPQQRPYAVFDWDNTMVFSTCRKPP